MILLLSFLPLALLGGFSYYHSKNYMKDELVSASQTNLQQINHTMDLIIQQLLDSSRQFLLDPVIEEYVSYPDGGYYENYEGNLRAEDLEGYYHYFSAKQKALRRMDILKVTNHYVDSIYLYDAGKNVVLQNGRASTPFEELADREWYEHFQQHTTFPVFMRERRTYMQPDNNEKSVITLIHSSWGSRGNERSALVVNLNADLLYADLFEGQEEAYSQNNRYVLFSPGYGLLLGKTEDAEEIRRMAERFEGDDGVNVYEEEDLIVMRTSSQLLNWELFNVRSFERYHASMKYLQWSLMAAHGSMIVLTLIVSIVFIRKLYQPIRWLIRYIENGEKSGKQVRMHGEMKLIASTLLNSVHKALKLQQTLEESMPAYREKFVLSLIRGSELPPDEVRRKFTFLGIPLRPDNVVPIVLLARRHQADREDPILEMTKSLDLQDIVQAKAAEAGAALVVSLDDEKLLLLVNTEQENMLGVYHLLQSIRRHVWDSISVSLIIGVGAHCRYVHEWPKAFQEAEEALRFGILHGKEDIYSIYDVQVGRPASGNELHVDEESILNGIRGGDVVKTGEAFRMFLQDISRSNPEKRELQHLLIRLLGKIIVASDQIGLRSHLLDRENLKVLDILYWGTEQEMTDWFERFVAALAAETSSLMNEKDNKHIEYIERRLQEDMTLNLDTLSRELNMNPAYLSRIFKEKINENFIDYFTRIKIEKSKELLERTETKVKEIAKMLGYESSSYFSAVFKKHTGCTPNQYRVLRKSR